MSFLGYGENILCARGYERRLATACAKAVAISSAIRLPFANRHNSAGMEERLPRHNIIGTPSH